MKSTTLATINERYSDTEWLHIFTDGSYMNKEDVGADIYCKYFTQYVTLDRNFNNYDGELEAIKQHF